MAEDSQTERVSLWSVLNKYWSLFVWVLVVFLIVWTVLFAVSYDFTKHTDGDDQTSAAPFRPEVRITIALVFMKDYASYTLPVMMAVAVTFVLLMDGKENIQVTITRWLRQKADEEQYKLGKAEGKAETNFLWAEWLRRRERAAKNNEPFDEPPPEI